MAGRKPARYLAPIALLAVGAAIGLEIKNHEPKSRSGPPHSTLAGSGGPTSHLTEGTRLPATTHKARKFYTVRPGDTLSGISAKTGVAVATIQHLNPGLNPSALQTGQRLRLRR